MTAVQIFNNPNIKFKSETYAVLMIIAWTYLLHAYYRRKKIEYRYYTKTGKIRKFDRTKHGAFKYWELERCLNEPKSPIDKSASQNLRFLIGLRHEIEHQMTTRIDDFFSAKFQACCLNYNHYIKHLFSNDWGIDNYLSFSLQFSTISIKQKEMLSEHSELPGNISGYIDAFEEDLTDDEFKDSRFAYRLFFLSKTANHKGQADRVIEFVKDDSSLTKEINKEYAIIKETEKKKYLPGEIVQIMKDEGYEKFIIHEHTQFWKERDARNIKKGFGTWVTGKQWYWYENWLVEVRKYCCNNRDKYT